MPLRDGLHTLDEPRRTDLVGYGPEARVQAVPHHLVHATWQRRIDPERGEHLGELFELS